MDMYLAMETAICGSAAIVLYLKNGKIFFINSPSYECPYLSTNSSNVGLKA